MAGVCAAGVRRLARFASGPDPGHADARHVTGLAAGFNVLLSVLACLIGMILVMETAWNSLVARIFSMDRTRAAYISLKTVIDRSFGAALALLGVKIVAT